MSYRIHARERIDDAIRRVVREEIDAAVAEINEASLDPDILVHEARKHAKRIRAAVRLVRDRFPDTYDRENAFFRDEARKLSGLRDAATMVDAFEGLVADDDELAGLDETAAIRRVLRERRMREERSGATVREQLGVFRDALRSARARISDWPLEAEGPEALEESLLRVYRRARKRMRKARNDRSTELLHDWRKRVKYHWYHSRLLREIAPSVMKKRAKKLSKLADLLGLDHDLAVLRQALTSDDPALPRQGEIEPILSAIDARRRKLQRKSLPRGAKLFKKKPSKFLKSFRAAIDEEGVGPAAVVEADGVKVLELAGV